MFRLINAVLNHLLLTDCERGAHEWVAPRYCAVRPRPGGVGVQRQTHRRCRLCLLSETKWTE